jgi:hypothetical protein
MEGMLYDAMRDQTGLSPRAYDCCIAVSFSQDLILEYFLIHER